MNSDVYCWQCCEYFAPDIIKDCNVCGFNYCKRDLETHDCHSKRNEVLATDSNLPSTDIDHCLCGYHMNDDKTYQCLCPNEKHPVCIDCESQCESCEKRFVCDTVFSHIKYPGKDGYDLVCDTCVDDFILKSLSMK